MGLHPTRKDIMIRSIQTLTRRVGGLTPDGNPKCTTGRLTQVVTTGARGVIALLLLGSAVGLQARDMVSVAKPEINMRAGPGTHHPTLWTLAQGYPLEVLQTQGQWFKVRDFEKDVGWVYRPLVSKVPHVVVKSRVANVRQAPSTRARILDKAEYGDVMRQLERRAGWVKVQRTDGPAGWIARQLLWGR